MTIRTDLAIECREMFAGELAGVENLREDSDGLTVSHVKITTEEGARQIGKPKGNYVTVEINEVLFDDPDIFQRGSEAVGRELKKLCEEKKPDSVLIVGLGNRYITPDSIGPKVVGKVMVTRHITKDAEFGFDFPVRPVSAVSPGVLGITGIETGEIVKGVAEHVKPSLIIAVDALAARSLSRLGTTVQLCDTGICPGSGVGNNRKELTEKTLGVPVIAIGVPMVVDIKTLALEVLDIPEKNDKKDISCNIPENRRDMIVTLNDVDSVSEKISEIIAEGINIALHS